MSTKGYFSDQTQIQGHDTSAVKRDAAVDLGNKDYIVKVIHNNHENSSKTNGKEVKQNAYRATESVVFNFRVKCELGALIFLLVTYFIVSASDEIACDWLTILRLHRGFLLLTIFLILSSLSVIIWDRHDINYRGLFEIDHPDPPLSTFFLESGCLLGIIWLISIILQSSKNLIIPTDLLPLAAALISIAFFLNPLPYFHGDSRNWCGSVFIGIIKVIQHPVKFREYWVADHLLSLVPILLDFEYITCHYTNNLGSSGNVAVVCMDSLQATIIRTVITSMPVFFRFFQCLRYCHDENSRRLFHLVNAARHVFMFLMAVLTSTFQYQSGGSFKSTNLGIILIVLCTFTTCWTIGWNMVNDFGVFQSREAKNNKFPTLLRERLTYPICFYYFVIVEESILQFDWIITTLQFPDILDPDLAFTVRAGLELIRRFLWGIVRMEYEFVSTDTSEKIMD